MGRAVRVAVRVGVALVVVAVVYVGVTMVQVWWWSRQDGARPAEAIVVMGAAQWDGRPSPVLRARLDHAADLWEQGLAEVIVVTGGKQPGDTITQGLAGYVHLRERGVPEHAILVEVDGTDSFEELSASAAIVRSEGLEPRVVIVTDPYHALRVSQIADEVGLTAYVSPTRTASPPESLLRETAAVALGRLVGFRRLSNVS